MGVGEKDQMRRLLSLDGMQREIRGWANRGEGSLQTWERGGIGKAS